MNHVPADLIRRYAHGDEIPTDQLWTVETHGGRSVPWRPCGRWWTPCG
jgi:hypothetical protein